MDCVIMGCLESFSTPQFPFPLGQGMGLNKCFQTVLSGGEKRFHWIEIEHLKTTGLYSKALSSNNILLSCCRNKLFLHKSQGSDFQWVNCFSCLVCECKSVVFRLCCLELPIIPWGISVATEGSQGGHGKDSRLSALAFSCVIFILRIHRSLI